MNLSSIRTSSILLTFVTVLVACGKQGEGETCVRSNGDADCDSGLVCVAASKLEDSSTSREYAADRCCPKDESDSSDPRCERRSEDETGEDGNGGSAGADQGGSSSDAGADQGGSSSDAGAGQSGSAGADTSSP